jgi:hypothetical protein
MPTHRVEQDNGDRLPDHRQCGGAGGLAGEPRAIMTTLASVGGRRLTNSQAGDVDQRLIVSEQEPDQQVGTAVVDVHRHGDAARSHRDLTADVPAGATKDCVDTAHRRDLTS